MRDDHVWTNLIQELRPETVLVMDEECPCDPLPHVINQKNGADLPPEIIKTHAQVWVSPTDGLERTGGPIAEHDPVFNLHDPALMRDDRLAPPVVLPVVPGIRAAHEFQKTDFCRCADLLPGTGA